MNLDEQIKRLASGDMGAFEDVYRETHRAVYYTALSIVRDRGLAEDVMQNCYLNVIHGAAQYRTGTSGKAWIVRIARNEALNLAKRRAREQSVDEREQIARFGTQEAEEYGYLIALARKVLSPEAFMIVMLITVEGYKRRELAEILGQPIPTVTWKYRQALGHLRQILEKEGDE